MRSSVPHPSAVAWATLLAALTAAGLGGCTHPPLDPGAVALHGPAVLPDCDAPPVPAQQEGCRDEAPRPPAARPVDRPGVDRDGDGVEDILDRCPDLAPAPGTDADGDGCPDQAPAPSGR